MNTPNPTPHLAQSVAAATTAKQYLDAVALTATQRLIVIPGPDGGDIRHLEPEYPDGIAENVRVMRDVISWHTQGCTHLARCEVREADECFRMAWEMVCKVPHDNSKAGRDPAKE